MTTLTIARLANYFKLEAKMKKILLYEIAKMLGVIAGIFVIAKLIDKHTTFSFITIIIVSIAFAWHKLNSNKNSSP